MGAAPAEPTTADLMAAMEQLRSEVQQLKAALPSPMVDVNGVADHLNVSLRTVRRMIANKEIAVVRVGRSLRFDLRQFSPPA